jgi:hypothetical protein
LIDTSQRGFAVLVAGVFSRAGGVPWAFTVALGWWKTKEGQRMGEANGVPTREDVP